MRIVFFSAKPYDALFFTRANAGHGHELIFLETHLDARNAVLAKDAGAVCVFVNDHVDGESLGAQGVRLLALRCAGFNNVDLTAAKRLGVTIARVPAYSPHAVAEHAVALLLSLNRKLHRAYARVREANFSLTGLLGFDLYRRTVGVVGMGEIGCVFANIMRGFGCRVLAFDPKPKQEPEGVEFVAWEKLLADADIISLHCPLRDYPTKRYLVRNRERQFAHGQCLSASCLRPPRAEAFRSTFRESSTGARPRTVALARTSDERATGLRRLRAVCCKSWTDSGTTSRYCRVRRGAHRFTWPCRRT